MTTKQFFKSTTFKCLITLLCVLLVSGIFLTIMNSLLKVTDQEKFDRAINKIYGQSVKTEAVADIEQYNDNATIEEAYIVKDDGNYLIKVTGKGGYDNGTVTCWVVVAIKNKTVVGIDKVVIDSNVGQSYIDRVGSKALNQFSEFYEDGIIYTPGLITGATVMGTKNAICNAVNAALDFANAKCGNVETEAQKLIKNITNLYAEEIKELGEDLEVSVYGLDENGNEKKIEETDETVRSFIEKPVTIGNATVNSLYKLKIKVNDMEITHYVVSSTGKGGYSDGTVTMLTSLAIENGAIIGVYKVIITGNVGQSYIDNINHLDKYPEAGYTDGFEFSNGDGFKTSGASMSSTAINNAINGALRYVEENIGNLYTAEGGQDNE